jgi:ParB/RepB/Spo0J family partition protein
MIVAGASKFDKAKSSKSFDDVKKVSKEKAVVPLIKILDNDKLFDYKNNDEDILNTADLEESIKELGFVDPIEVTDYEMPNGKYTILSGHRRRNAGVKQGMKSFPCFVKSFKTSVEVQNYVLYANSHRDSIKDPLLIAKRYRAAKEYLRSTGMTTGFREEIAKRLGLSAIQADRYNRLLEVIPEVWALIQSSLVGMSSIIKMSSYNEKEQHEILNMLMDCHNGGIVLTRARCDIIIAAYSKGIKSYDEIKNETVKAYISSEEDITDDNIDGSQHSDSLITAEEDKEHGDNVDDKGDSVNDTNSEKSDEETRISNFVNNEQAHFAEAKHKKQGGLRINRHIKELKTKFNEGYSFDSKETAVDTMRTMQGIMRIMIDELKRISDDYDSKEVFDEGIQELLNDLKKYDVIHCHSHK